MASYEYTGIAPPYSDFSTFFEEKVDQDILKASIVYIVLTQKGERVMLPEFGSDVHKMVFDQNDSTLASSLEREIREAVARWDPRIELVDVEVTQTDENVLCKVKYRDLRSSQDLTDEVQFSIV